ncbi:hypothetical protein KCP78_16100 [Salmonella enterica subsp. enterica]|nr:hypothetical protein KCP78_16100 [Salmonella enterica subsp. enterica]
MTNTSSSFSRRRQPRADGAKDWRARAGYYYHSRQMALRQVPKGDYRAGAALIQLGGFRLRPRARWRLKATSITASEGDLIALRWRCN